MSSTITHNCDRCKEVVNQDRHKLAFLYTQLPSVDLCNTCYKKFLNEFMKGK